MLPEMRRQMDRDARLKRKRYIKLTNGWLGTIFLLGFPWAVGVFFIVKGTIEAIF